MEDQEEPKALTEQLKGWLSTGAATLVSAVVSVGFVAFAGKAILWTRFTALQVPAEQVVKAVPQSEAVATGASILLIFGFFGAIATVALYLTDRGGRATLGTGRMLLALVTLEGAGAIVLANQEGDSRIMGAAVALALVAALVLAMTFASWLVEFKDTLRSRPSETFKPKPAPGSGPDGGQQPSDPVKGQRPPASDKGQQPADAPIQRLALLGVLLVGGLVVLAVLLLADVPAWGVVAGAVAVVGFGVVAGVVAWKDGSLQQIHQEKEVERQGDQEREEELFKETAKKAGESRRKASGEEKEKKRQQQEEREAEEERLRAGKHRPHRFALNFEGGLVLAFLAVVAIAFPALVLKQWWFAISIGTAVVLAFGLWRVACLSKPGFVWFGLAAFLSVPLFGALTLMARNFGHPQAQPVAIIRKTDGPDEVIQGLYVTEASDRVYFANVATEGCGDKIKPRSGRLLWVPRDEVVAMSVGPLQDVEEAGRAALEMAYELTPAVETPRAGAVSLTVAEEQTKKIREAKENNMIKEIEERTAGRDQRLQSPGPAVRPSFGSGLQLVPEIASPGEAAELRLSSPNAYSGGFGPTPRGRMLRLNGVPVPVLRERSPHASRAEYVVTQHHQVLTLQKRQVYGLTKGVFPFPLEGQQYSGSRFVKLEDSDVAEVRGGGLPAPNDELLRIDGEGAGPQLAESAGELPEVKLVGERHFVRLEPRLLRQAWERDRIAFRVPRQAKSGVVTIDCGQLAGAPLLRVATPPVARIEARMRGGSKRVVLDGGHSRDAGGQRLSERWSLGKHSLGKHEQVALTLRPRLRPYRVRLTVTDPEGVNDSAELLLLRLPESFFAFGKAGLGKQTQERRLEAAHASLEGFVNRHRPSSIELDGNADDVGSASFNVTLSLKRAKRVRKTLLASRAHASAAAPAGTIPVVVRAFGETCPVVGAPGRQRANRRVDVFVLDRGDRIVDPKGCKVGEEEHSRW